MLISQYSMAEDDEKLHFEKCVKAFRYYKKYVFAELNKNISDFKGIPLSHQKMLPNFIRQQSDVKRCTEINFMFILQMLDEVNAMFTDEPSAESDMGESDNISKSFINEGSGITQSDMDRVFSTIRQFVRDWSEIGKNERDKCYSPIINAVLERYSKPSEVDILVPGAGLGRLAFEFASRGYNCEGNEFSIYMLIGSNFVLNKTDSVPFQIYPWCSTSTNNVTHEHRIAPVDIPDIETTSIPADTKFGMCAGEFVQVYSKDTDK